MTISPQAYLIFRLSPWYIFVALMQTIILVSCVSIIIVNPHHISSAYQFIMAGRCSSVWRPKADNEHRHRSMKPSHDAIHFLTRGLPASSYVDIGSWRRVCSPILHQVHQTVGFGRSLSSGLESCGEVSYALVECGRGRREEEVDPQTLCICQLETGRDGKSWSKHIPGSQTIVSTNLRGLP